DHVRTDPRHACGDRRRPEGRPRRRRRRDTDLRGAPPVGGERQRLVEASRARVRPPARELHRQALDAVRTGRRPRLHAREGHGLRRHGLRRELQPLALRRGQRRERAADRGRRAARADGGVRRRDPREVPALAAVSLDARVRPAAGEPEGALVLLHGRGADELDLFPLLDFFDPERRFVAATPRAPLALTPGGWHWYAFMQVGYPEPATFHRVYPQATGWRDAFLAGNGVSHERLVLGGFSQGGVMSYALGLGAGRPRPAALFALSGFIPTVEGFELDLAPPLPPVAIGHGTLDPV